FDPLLLLGQNNICHLCVVRRELVDEAGGFREGYEGSQDWDLLLRVTERLAPGQVVHVPHILYHWRTHLGSTASSLGAKPYAAGAGWRAVRDHLERRAIDATARPVPGLGWNRIDWAVPEPAPLVSLVVRAGGAGTGDEGRWLERCLQSIWRRTSYAGYEIVVVAGPETGAEARRFLDGQAGRLQVVEAGSSPGLAAGQNEGAARTTGAVLCFLDGATEVRSPDWLEVLVGQLLRPATGVVGAKLYDDRGRVRHAGLVLGLGGVAGPVHRGLDSLDIGYWGRAALPRALSAVGGGCLAVRREAFDQAGGFDDGHLSADDADVDLCLRLAEAGWATVWTPYAELVRHGPAAESPAHPEAARYMAERWGGRLERDPAYNPNLSLARPDFSPAEPPRVRLPGR
ncbi:MAG TPA: glycosyltransferase, partial [Acidimicrobiales bacterium]|nr:glycosyltransferase [Acidimicrobiales bacterium]